MKAEESDDVTNTIFLNVYLYTLSLRYKWIYGSKPPEKQRLITYLRNEIEKLKTDQVESDSYINHKIIANPVIYNFIIKLKNSKVCICTGTFKRCIAKEEVRFLISTILQLKGNKK